MSVNPKQDIGAKKAPLSLVPPALTIAVSAALADGADKYGAYNYRESSVNASTYYEAALRHLAAWWDGEDIASDSGVDHLAHAAACLAILLDTKSIDRMVDDRPPSGAAAAMLAALDRSKPADSIYVEFRAPAYADECEAISVRGYHCSLPDQHQETMHVARDVIGVVSMWPSDSDLCGDCGGPRYTAGVRGICAGWHNESADEPEQETCCSLGACDYNEDDAAD